MIVAMLTTIAAMSVAALYLYEMHQTERRHKADPIRSGREPEFAHLGEQEWYDSALTSLEWTR